jgi:anaerobic magnesium-protoporphyrin IX monomethyl ester cyclase
MRVLLTHGYFIHEDPKEQEIMKPYPPLGLLYISAYLEQQGYDNEVFDSTFSSIEKLKEKLLSTQPDVIGIYTNLMTKLNVLRIVQFIKSRPELQNTKVILGGPEVRHHKDKFLEHGADVIVFGEGENTMLEVVKAFQKTNQPDLSVISGIAYTDTNGEVKVNAERELKKEVDELPLPNRKKIDLQLYFDAWKNRHGHSVVSINTMRGCPYDCKWCSRAVYGQSYRRRSPANVVAEMKWLKENYTFDMIWFVDDVFTVNYPWLREFSAELERQNLKIPYEVITRADRMNEQIIDVLKETGCYRVWIGAESGSQKIIDAMSRRVKVEQVRSMIQLSQQKGIQAGTFIMLGYPGETEEDITETLHHLKVADPDLYTLTVAYPIKGTPLYTEVENRFIKELPWETSTDRDIDFTRNYSRKYYDYAIRWIYNEVALAKAVKKKSFHRAPYLKLKSLVAKAGMVWSR